jgi:hypothetical protein
MWPLLFLNVSVLWWCDRAICSRSFSWLVFCCGSGLIHHSSSIKVLNVKLWERMWLGGSIQLLFLNLSTRWRWAIKFKPRPLDLRREYSQNPLNGRVGELQRLSRRCGVPGIELQFLYCQSRNLVSTQDDRKVSVHVMITVQKTRKNILTSFNHLPCGQCCTEHGLREHSSACQ